MFLIGSIVRPDVSAFVSAALDAEETEVEMTSLRARATALEQEKKALEDELPHLRGTR